jgi:hypothetical protein
VRAEVVRVSVYIIVVVVDDDAVSCSALLKHAEHMHMPASISWSLACAFGNYRVQSWIGMWGVISSHLMSKGPHTSERHSSGLCLRAVYALQHYTLRNTLCYTSLVV